jgi:hypothetical protein
MREIFILRGVYLFASEDQQENFFFHRSNEVQTSDVRADILRVSLPRDLER